MTARQIIRPVLQAEWDLRYLEMQKAKLEEEARVMKDVSCPSPGLLSGAAPPTRAALCPEALPSPLADTAQRVAPQVPGWKVGEGTTKHRWLPPMQPITARSLI